MKRFAQGTKRQLTSNRVSANGSLRIDRQIKKMGIPRLQVITGTSDVRQSRERNSLVGLLITAGATDVIMGLHRGDITVAELWQEYERSDRVLLDLVSTMNLRRLTGTSVATMHTTSAPFPAVLKVMHDGNGVMQGRPEPTDTTSESFWNPIIDLRARAEAAYNFPLWPTLENVDAWAVHTNLSPATTQRYRVSILALHDLAKLCRVADADIRALAEFKDEKVLRGLVQLRQRGVPLEDAVGYATKTTAERNAMGTELSERRIGDSALDALTHVPSALVRVLTPLDGRPPRRDAVRALKTLSDEVESARSSGSRQEAKTRLDAAREFGTLLSETSRIRDLLRLGEEHWKALYVVWGASDTDWMHMRRSMMACLTKITGSHEDPVRRRVIEMIPLHELPTRTLALTVEQFRLMLAELSELEFAIVMTIAAAGLRVSEYLRLEPQHLASNTCMIDVPGRKTKKSTGAVAVHPDYWRYVLQAVPAMIGKSAIRYLLQKACRAAGLQGIRVHDLRHCLGHYAGAGGATRSELQTALRHESPEMTQRYMAPPDLTSVAVAFHATVGAVNSLHRELGRQGGEDVKPTAPNAQSARAPELDSMTRERLYGLVWATPIQQLAKRYGISNVTLSKRCAKRNIPTPPRGYWQRKQQGMAVSVVALPAENASEQQ